MAKSSPSTSESDTEPVTADDTYAEAEVFNQFFLYSCLHGTHYMTKKTSCVVELPNGEVITFHSIGAHAEMNMINGMEDDYLKDQPKDNPITIKCWQNYSPCSDCAEQLVAFVKKHKCLTIHIRVATWYNVNRESCKDCTSHVSKAVSNKTKDGLKSINRQDRLKIKFFQFQHWEKLARILGLPEPTEKMYKDSQKGQHGNRSRCKEDEYVASDFVNILS